MVPREPTRAMLEANGRSVAPEGNAWLERDARETWAAMLAASPHPEPESAAPAVSINTEGSPLALRLRVRAPCSGMLSCELMNEAADRLDALTAERNEAQAKVRALHAKVNEWARRAEAAEQQLAASEAALREAREWRDAQDRPTDGALVAYLFEPFGTYHVGRYFADEDCVSGKAGFTTWQPEVTAWFPLPAIDAATKEPT